MTAKPGTASLPALALGAIGVVYGEQVELNCQVWLTDLL